MIRTMSLKMSVNFTGIFNKIKGTERRRKATKNSPGNGKIRKPTQFRSESPAKQICGIKLGLAVN